MAGIPADARAGHPDADLRVRKQQKGGKSMSKAHVAQATGNNEWYTPQQYTTAARDVLGRIDLDPASCSTANAVVGATTYYTQEQDGLAREWHGRVWLNPPYSVDLLSPFISKLASEYEVGNVTEAIILTNNATETKWFAALAQIATHLCLLRSRIKFWHPDKTKAAPLQGQVIAYVGAHGDRFAKVFADFGMVVKIEKDLGLV